MKRHRAVWLAPCAVMLALWAGFACGGDDDRSLLPQLEGTPLPTATPPTCAVLDPLPLPANFPPDVVVPPNYLIETVETEPSLKLEGRIDPPPDAAGVLSPIQVLEVAIKDNMPGWTFGENQSVAGLDYTFTHADGRSGRYTSDLVDGCPHYHLALTYELPFVTP